MDYVIERERPGAIQEELLDLLWEHRHWPGHGKDDYRALWEWRYTSLGQVEPIVWVAREPGEGRMIGHLALFPRRFRCGDLKLWGAIPGDLLVHRDRRSPALALDLLRAECFAVSSGEFDFVLSLAPHLVHQLHLRLKFRALGLLRDYVDLRKSRSALQRRFAPAIILAPMIDAYLAVRRRIRRWQLHLHRLRRRFRVTEMGGAELEGFPRNHWIACPDGVVGDDPPEYIVRRYFSRVEGRRSIVAVTEPNGMIQAYSVIGGDGERASVLDCQTNGEVLDVSTALALTADYLSGRVSSIVVSTAERSELATRLLRYGFLRRRRDRLVLWASVYTESHDLLKSFINENGPARWNIFAGHADF